MLKWVLGGLAALAAGFAAILVVNTANVRAPELPTVELAEPPSIDADAAAAHLSEAVRIQTVSRTPGVVEDPAAFEALRGFLERTYPRTHAAMTREIVDGHSLLFTLRGSDPSLAPILLLAHQDVVPVEAGTEGDWEAPPFSGAIQNGYVIGRGAADDKGSLITIMEAMEALLARGFQPRRTIMFAFGHDEETRGAGAQAMAALLAERRQRAWFVLDEGMAIVADFPLTGGPVALIGIAEKGYFTVRVTARGEGGHSSRPPRETAAERLSHAILAIRAHPFQGDLTDGPAPQLLAALVPSMSYAPRFFIANRWVFGPLIEGQLAADPTSDALLRTTIAPTMINGGTKENVLPQQMQATVNLRLHPRDTMASALAHLRASVSGIQGVTIEPIEGGSDPSPVASTTSDSYALIAAAAEVAGPTPDMPVAPMLVLGATDSRHYAGVAENVYRFAPTVGGQEELTRIHGTGERMSVENLGRMARFYAQLIATGSK